MVEYSSVITCATFQHDDGSSIYFWYERLIAVSTLVFNVGEKFVFFTSKLSKSNINAKTDLGHDNVMNAM